MTVHNTKIFLTPIRPAVLNTDPSAGLGTFYFNANDGNYRYFDGTTWQPFGTGSGGGGGTGSGTVIIIDGGYANSNYADVANNFIASLDGGAAV